MSSEVRTSAADNLWMSPCYQQACVPIHFTWKLNWEGVRQLLPEIEAQLAPFDARPHWGQAVYHGAGAAALALSEAAGFPTAADILRSTGQILQSVPGYLYLWGLECLETMR